MKRQIGNGSLVAMITAVLGVSVMSDAVAAKVLRLQGTGDSTTWDNTTATWLDESDNLTTYCGAWDAGDDAIIGGTWFTGSALTLNFWCHAGNVVFTNSQNIAFNTRKDGATSPALASQTKSIQKWGEGMLTVDGGCWMYNECSWDLYQGTLTPSGSSRPSSRNGAWLWGAVSETLRPRINVYGGVLEGHGNESFGKISTTVEDEDSCSDVTVHAGGTFRPGITANCSNGYPLSLLHDLTIDGGALDVTKKGSWSTGLLAVYHRLAFSGASPYTLSFSGQCGKLIVSRARQTEINVADITGDAKADVTFNDSNIGPLGSPTDYSVGIRKTGAGTMVFAKQIKNSEDGGLGRGLIGLNGKITVEEGLLRFDDGSNKNEGDIEVTGGVLRFGSGESAYTVPSDLGQTYAGSMLKEGRTITASGSGSIHFVHRYMFYCDSGKGVETVAPATFAATNGGELVIGATDWSGTGKAYVAFPNLRLADGGKVTLRPESGDWPNGAYGVMGKFSFGGSTPITVSAGTKQNHAFLLNSGASTVFDVEDITKDSEVDATFSLQMGRYTYNIAAESQKQVGFRKTGAGTFKIDFSTGGLGAAGMKGPNGTIAVEEGTLMAGTSLKDASIAVSAGAYLQTAGGVGRPQFKALTMAENGGFRVSATNLTSAIYILDSVTLPTVGVVDILAENAEVASKTKAFLMTLPSNSTVTSADFDMWKVTVNGQTDKSGSYKIFRQGDDVYVKNVKGMVVFIK